MQHEPLGLGYRTRYYNQLTSPVNVINDQEEVVETTTTNTPVHDDTNNKHHVKTFEESTTKTTRNGINNNDKGPKQRAPMNIQDLLGISHHRIFEQTPLRQQQQQRQTGPPINDECSQAQIITTLPFAAQSTTVGSTPEEQLGDDDDESCGAQSNVNGVWYSFTPTTSGLYKTYVNSGLNLGIRIYSSSSSDSTSSTCNGNDLACVSQFNSLHTFIGVANTEYKLLVSSAEESSGGTSFVFVLDVNDATPFPTTPKDDGIVVPPTLSPVGNNAVGSSPPQSTPMPTTNKSPTDNPIANYDDNDSTTNIGPAEINFINLSSEVTNDKSKIIMYMEHQIGSKFDVDLYSSDCVTPVTNVDIDESEPLVTHGILYDEVTLIYTIDRTSLVNDDQEDNSSTNNKLDLCVVFQLQDENGMTIIQEKRQVGIEISSEEQESASNSNSSSSSAPSKKPIVVQPPPEPLPSTCSVCSTGLTVPSSTPVGSVGKTCGTLLVNASKVTEGSANCMAMMAAIPTCCPGGVPSTAKPTYNPTPMPVILTPRPTVRATRPPQQQTYPPPFESSWGKPPPPSPPPTIDCGWASSSDIEEEEWGSSSNSSGSSAYLFGSKGSKAAYNKCYHGKTGKSKSSKSKYGKSDKEGWGSGGWVYANSELDKIKLLPPASSSSSVIGGYVLLLSTCLIVGLKVLFW